MSPITLQLTGSQTAVASARGKVQQCEESERRAAGTAAEIEEEVRQLSVLMQTQDQVSLCECECGGSDRRGLMRRFDPFSYRQPAGLLSHSWLPQIHTAR